MYMSFVSKEGRKLKYSNLLLNRVKINEALLQIINPCNTVNVNFWNCDEITVVRTIETTRKKSEKRRIETTQG